MVVRFCERQTEQDNPTTCAIFHNEQKIYEYRPPEAACDSAHVVFAAQESHCFFYRKGSQIASKSKVRASGKSTAYSCCKVRETFEPERGQPWKDWRPYYELQPLMAESFLSLRRPKRTRTEDETRIERKAVYFYTKGNDLDGIYEECLRHQKELHGSELCFGFKRTYGSDAEKIASIRINAALLPAIVIKAVPLQADDLNVIAELAGLVYRGSTLAKFGDALRIARIKRVGLTEADQPIVME